MGGLVKIENQDIDIINIQLDFFSRRTRIAQIESILERIKRLPLADNVNHPIIHGDFNTGSKAFSDAVRQFMIRSTQHVHYTYHPQNECTFPAHFPSRGLDFVIAPKPYKVKNRSSDKELRLRPFAVLG